MDQDMMRRYAQWYDRDPGTAKCFAMRIAAKAWRQDEQIGPFMVRCPVCQAWHHPRMKGFSDGRLATTCELGHAQAVALDGSSGLVESSVVRGFQGLPDSADLALLRQLAEAAGPEWFRMWQKWRFKNPPYQHVPLNVPPMLGLHAAAFSDLPTNFHEQRILTIITRMLHPAPIYYWVTAPLLSALIDSPAPPRDMANLEWPHRAALFFLPRCGTVTPGGESIGFLAYAVVDGDHLTRDQWINVWAVTESGKTAYSAAWPVVGSFGDLKNHPLLHPPLSVDRKFVMNLARLAMVIQWTMQHAPGAITQAWRIVRPLRRRKRGPNRVAYCQAGILGRQESGVQSVKNGQCGQTMSPHWRPGWNQRYHRRGENGEWETVWHARPPQFINGHLLRRDHRRE